MSFSAALDSFGERWGRASQEGLEVNPAADCRQMSALTFPEEPGKRVSLTQVQARVQETDTRAWPWGPWPVPTLPSVA